MGEQVITMSVMIFRGLTILPGMVLYFDTNRPKSVTTVERAMAGDQELFLMAQRRPEIVEPEQRDLSQVSIVVVVKQLIKLSGEMVRVLVEGSERVELLCLEAGGPTMMGGTAAIEAEEDDLDSLTQEAMLCILKDKLEEYGRVNPKITKEALSSLMTITDLNEMLDQITIQLPRDYTIRQTVSENSSLSARYEVVIHMLLTGMEIYRIKKESQEKVKIDTDQNQKEYILGEQMKVIRQELGEDTVSDADEYQKKLDALKADRGIKEKLRKEIEHFRNMPAGSQEANVLRTCVETPLNLPWRKMSGDNDDIKYAERILNGDHYGLKQVKERTLECLAVCAPTKKDTSPIVCLVGPPGTGKTSIARSVARALNRKYVRISLGSIRDEAEVRGHGRTYVGIIPGRIVEGMRQASVSSSLVLLDEIDRVSSDYKDDTSSTPLEVLNGEQNVKFRSHYVELPIGLSQVLFIATANTTQTIPGPLLDRMELIEVSNYTENEKFYTARDYLVTKQMKRDGLKEGQITFPDKSLEKIIHSYTREADVRNLEHRIGDVCRRAARQFLEDKKKSIKIAESSLEKHPGEEKMTLENTNEEDGIDIVCDLAWASVEGDTLQTEINVVSGKGNLLMTGRLGDMMKESTQTALTCVRSVYPEYGTDDGYFEKRDLHTHISEGAAPKDGPSAGTTMVTAVLSAVTGKSVRARAATTGEITLRGRVLPIGGLEEKILAAKIVHIEKMLVPNKNRPDMAELSKGITRGLDTVHVKATEDVVSEAFAQSAGKNQEKQI